MPGMARAIMLVFILSSCLEMTENEWSVQVRAINESIPSMITTVGLSITRGMLNVRKGGQKQCSGIFPMFL